MAQKAAKFQRGTTVRVKVGGVVGYDDHQEDIQITGDIQNVVSLNKTIYIFALRRELPTDPGEILMDLHTVVINGNSIATVKKDGYYVWEYECTYGDQITYEVTYPEKVPVSGTWTVTGNKTIDFDMEGVYHTLDISAFPYSAVITFDPEGEAVESTGKTYYQIHVDVKGPSAWTVEWRDDENQTIQKYQNVTRSSQAPLTIESGGKYNYYVYTTENFYEYESGTFTATKNETHECTLEAHETVVDDRNTCERTGASPYSGSHYFDVTYINEDGVASNANVTISVIGGSRFEEITKASASGSGTTFTMSGQAKVKQYNVVLPITVEVYMMTMRVKTVAFEISADQNTSAGSRFKINIYQ